VIDSRYSNLQALDLIHYSVRLLTHSTNFDYFKIKPEWIIENDDKLITDESHLSTDTFIIGFEDIDLSRVYGHIDLDLVQ
jgi:hypothetical protein